MKFFYFTSKSDKGISDKSYLSINRTIVIKFPIYNLCLKSTAKRRARQTQINLKF